MHRNKKNEKNSFSRIILIILNIFFVILLIILSVYHKTDSNKNVEILEAIVEEEESVKSIERNEWKEEIKKVEKIKNKYLPGIVCWGDSLTAGAGGNGTNYPNVLNKLINEKINTGLNKKKMELYPDLYKCEKIESVPVVNMGVGGESTNTILGRNGAIPFITTEELTIPSDKTPVKINFTSENGKKVYPLEQGKAGLDYVKINNIEGNITLNNKENKRENYEYYFIRNNRGNEINVPKGSEIITAASEQNLNYLPIIFIGTNGGYDNDVNELILQQKAIINHQKDNPRDSEKARFIVIGLHTGSENERKDLENSLEKEYGDQYINLREYMVDKGLYDAGIKPTYEDIENMKKGMTPASLLNDDKLHFNSTGYALIGNLIFDRMNELGYFDEILYEINNIGK